MEYNVYFTDYRKNKYTLDIDIKIYHSSNIIKRYTSINLLSVYSFLS